MDVPVDVPADAPADAPVDVEVAAFSTVGRFFVGDRGDMDEAPFKVQPSLLFSLLSFLVSVMLVSECFSCLMCMRVLGGGRSR